MTSHQRDDHMMAVDSRLGQTCVHIHTDAPDFADTNDAIALPIRSLSTHSACTEGYL